MVRVGTGCGIGLIQRDAVTFNLGSVIKNLFRKINEVPVMRVWINGMESPVIGRIGVSHMTVDITEIPAKEGDKVKVKVNPLLVHPYVRRMVV